MKREYTFRMPNWLVSAFNVARPAIVLLTGVLFLWCLGQYLLTQALPDDLLAQRDLLVVALTVTAGLFVIGCLYSFITRAYMQTYICAVCILMGIGFAYQFFFGDFTKFFAMSFMGIALGITAYFVYRKMNVLSDRLYWLCAGSILALLLMNVVFGKQINGSRLWIDLKVFMFQPGELVKVLLIVLGASSFRNPIRGAAYCALSLFSCAILLFLKDLGGVLTIFSLFILMTYLLFDHKGVSTLIVVAAISGLIIALRCMPYAAARFANWGQAMSNPDSLQQRKYIIGVLMGGFKGLGVADHSLFTNVYAAQNDGALAGVMAVLGVPVVSATLGSYAIISSQALVNRSVYTSSFFIHAEIALFMAVQVLLNFAGALDLLPFTGVVAPLVSSGGTAIFCSHMLLGIGAAALNPALKVYQEVERGYE